VDSEAGEAMKLVARSHQTMIWERTRHVLRLRMSAILKFRRVDGVSIT